MTRDDFQERIRIHVFSLMKLADILPESKMNTAIADNLIRLSSEISEYVRLAHEGRTKISFISQISKAEQRLMESLFWLEVFVENSNIRAIWAEQLVAETKNILKIIELTNKSYRTVPEDLIERVILD
jgi:hypothetical protein